LTFLVSPDIIKQRIKVASRVDTSADNSRRERCPSQPSATLFVYSPQEIFFPELGPSIYCGTSLVIGLCTVFYLHSKIVPAIVLVMYTMIDTIVGFRYVGVHANKHSSYERDRTKQKSNSTEQIINI
jgi:hypothetical protein